ncbi:hypothetical protein ACWEG1_05720 [Streptomyces bauhiniae]
MSHFTVLVALPATTSPANIDAALTGVLTPFDENKQVDPYRNYETGNAVDYWRVNAMREDGQLPADGDVTWAQVAAAANHRDDLDPDDSDYLRVDEDGRAYTISTYNPASKWDWWVIGGRWTGYFLPTTEAQGDPRLVTGRPGTFGTPAIFGRVDGGPRGLLDLNSLRATKAVEAGQRYDEWTRLIDGLPAAQGWSHFLGRHKDLPETYSIDQARHDYGSQPQVQAARDSRKFLQMDCVIDEMAVGRDAYMADAADSAVPGYAYLDLNGTWHAPGDMGWFGMSSDDADSRTAYRKQVNAEVDGMDPDTYLVVVDCHI